MKRLRRSASAILLASAITSAAPAGLPGWRVLLTSFLAAAAALVIPLG